MVRNKTSRLQRNIHLLRALHSSKPARRRNLLKIADDDLIRALSDCALNLLSGNIPLDSKRKRTLKRYKRELIAVSEPSSSVDTKRKVILNQKGGFVSGALL